MEGGKTHTNWKRTEAKRQQHREVPLVSCLDLCIAMTQPKSNSSAGVPHEDRLNLYMVGRALRSLDRCTLLVIGLVFVFGALVAVIGSPSGGGFWLVGVIILIQSLGVLPMYRLERGLGSSMLMASARAASTLVPILGVVAMALQVSYGASVLARYGILLPMFGLRRRHVDALRDGYCVHCGYDIRTIKDRKCPECGEPIDRRSVHDE